MSSQHIDIKGAKQNNLKNLDIKIPLNSLVVVTGVSGSGKSSLAFDTIYAEGQRRYVETFSPYARQFLDRMDRPQVERIDGIPPAIAIDQANPVRTSRSTVGTMTELNDHLKLLFARTAKLHCHACGHAVEKDTPASILASMQRQKSLDSIMISFDVRVPDNFSPKEVSAFLEQNGYILIHQQDQNRIEVIQDRVRFSKDNVDRITEALEAALKHGHGHLRIRAMRQRELTGETWQFSDKLHCAPCDIDYSPVQASHFSFNSPIGACDCCRGFGRTIGINYQLAIPDDKKTIAEGAIKPFQSPSYIECQGDLMKYARKKGIPTDKPWNKLSAKQQQWVIEGDGDFDDKVWYGVTRFFKWLESKSYKMHIRVLLSKYRSYDECSACHGSRLKPHALLWRIACEQGIDKTLPREQRFMPPGLNMTPEVFAKMPGLSIQDIMFLPIEKTLTLFESLQLPKPFDEATELLLDEIRSRLRYLVDVGLGYLTLDRQSRTLSGGEVQRINLTTALGTSLVNTLFVLDEPSIGLHARDIERMAKTLLRLRDAGNSLIVVEHDADIMRHADYLLDIGPGPGELGGNKVFFGPAEDITRQKNSLTGDYLSGKREVLPENFIHRPPGEHTHWIEIKGACENNLKELDVRFPADCITTLTGVSGSGKSTLLHSVLYAGLQKRLGNAVESVGKHADIRGHDYFEAVHIVDQSPIGKTTRSNPVSYVGAWEEIRKLFAAQPLSKERKYTPGTFSFNSGNGRCPTCSGNGFEHIEMQFLSDVYLRCGECNGTRYRKEILDVSLLPDSKTDYPAKSVADILDLSVTEALVFFAGHEAVLRSLRPLVDVGLGYVRLGQPVPTLSGGEAQRLKLAGHLARTSAKQQQRMLFLFDEPSTGLHFHDIKVLLGAFQQLREAGHTLIIIEHNLDIIAASDWVVDLGPEGGDQGGRLIDCATPKALANKKNGHTSAALRDYFQGKAFSATSSATKKSTGENAIIIHNAREHNLKNIDLRIPRDKLTVITGLSGSGKSTIAFDILFAEGQRRYLESLNAYARQFVQPAGRADIDAIYGIPPTVAIEQRTSRGGYKSTVATVTEIYHFLRLLYVKLGTQFCPVCDIPIQEQSQEEIVANIFKQYRNKTIHLLAPLVVNRKGYYTDLAAWAANKGYDHLIVDGEAISTAEWPRLDRYKEHNIDLPVATLRVAANKEEQLRREISNALTIGKGVLRIQTERGKPQLFSIHRACISCGESFEALDPRLFSYNSKHGWCESCHGNGYITDIDEENYDEDDNQEARVCPQCDGDRLNPVALSVKFKQQSIAQMTRQNVEDTLKQFQKMKLAAREKTIAEDIVKEIVSRLQFLAQVGLAYLDLNRAAPTLSGGEAQRIRLAAQLGTNLQGVCYILDEPTIGLHPHDNKMLLKSLQSLEKKGNTLVVVEHDEDTIRMAQHIVDLGPGAGKRGGEIIAQGTLAQLKKNKNSITGRYMANPLKHPMYPRRIEKAETFLSIEKANLHNLREVSVKLPLGRFVVVTGVSGSGKSTLIRHVLLNNLRENVGKKTRKAVFSGCKSIHGHETLQRVLEVDQSPIGKTPRSCPATYIGFWDQIRRIFADVPEARVRGYNASRFSFNTSTGTCPACKGQGMQRLEMSFLPNVSLKCDVCNGKRFTDDTLDITYRGKNIADILEMNIDEAVIFFEKHKSIYVSLKLLQDIGLGYLTLGQASPTLSGGEAQRIKLVTELSKSFITKAHDDISLSPRKNTRQTLFILDEPTVGLHMADVEKLIHVFHQLVDAGNSLIVIEHNMDIMAEADWLVDMGPGGGRNGGRIVAQGVPEKLAGKFKSSKTTEMLQDFL
ncbi:MAG: excinuclease ABC subunit UvrA [Gammaproteobacteria bacterium]|nr:excinuclease ABC subunit UvrA [Gammaproteobacteria bacterium]